MPLIVTLALAAVPLTAAVLTVMRTAGRPRGILDIVREHRGLGGGDGAAAMPVGGVDMRLDREIFRSVDGLVDPRIEFTLYPPTARPRVAAVVARGDVP